MAIIISLNIVAINCRYVSVDASFEERPFKSRKVNYRHDYSEEYVEHIYYEDEEPEKPEPKPEEPKPEEPKPESTEKWTLDELKVKFFIKKETFVPDVVDFIKKFNGRIQKSTIEAPQAIFNKLPKESKTIKDWLDTKTVNKWEDQPEVSSAFEKIRGEMEKVYSVSNWEKPIEDGKDKGKVKQKQLWHKALFLIDALFQLYAKVLTELTNLVDKNNEQVITEICADKVKNLDKEKNCSKGLEALVKMNKENIEKVDDFYKLHDNFGKEDKVTDAAETIYAFPKLFRDWLREKTHDWKEQPEATKAFNYIKEEITKIYSLKEDITRLNAQRNWPYHLFLLHTLFEFFESIFAEARKQISSKNNSVINQICDEKISEKESEKCVDWLNNLSKILEKCNEKIGTVFSAKFKNLFEKWDDFSKNIKGKFEVELDAGDAPAPPPEARKVRKVVNIRERGEVKYFHPKSFDYSQELEFHPGYHFPRRHLRHRGPYEIKGKYHIKSRSNKV
uniref:Uncharacterized protein n=1 Tax=Meloidogyne floridensis TaxID=298350 RepID=A0A915PGK2_9BILA